ncbi:hypothetical protein T4A_4146 [Trichinella pseudospiralis]|uniref:Uncharacterized protein n=1 Tax=Trichinella pseudospiralis TaxID=6337 RepID=A0A0V1E0D4_TRIPS|nr:hypothetical protein T4A_4146 [Trichinella pseudospiralis]
MQPTGSRTDTTENQVLVQHLITKKWSTPCFITQVEQRQERPNGEISVGYAYRSKKWTRTRYRSSVKVYIKTTLIERPQASTQRPRKATNQ